MINSDALRLQLVQDIINLPDDLVPLVRDFLAELNDEDPMSNFIGCVSYDPPAKSIDEELYGESKIPDDSSGNGGNDEQYTDVKSPTGDGHRQSAE